MQVLGALIRLPKGLTSLPLPWWHRAPLGLLDKTPVHVAMLEPSKRLVGDVIVSVLDPHKWERTLRINVRKDDGPGVVADLLSMVSSLNVALAETVTVDPGSKHHATLICEVVGTNQNPNDHIRHIRSELQKQKFDNDCTVHQFADRPLLIEKSEVVRVSDGWLRDLQLGEWLSTIPDHNRQRIDFDKAVVSADTERRVLRFVFPRHGARTVTIQHADEPKTLHLLTEVLSRHNLNMLSALLRRGGQEPKDAELLTVCEPEEGNEPDEQFDKMRADLDKLPKGLRVRHEIQEDKRAESVISLQTPCRGLRPVLVCTDFAGPQLLHVQQLSRILQEQGCRPIIGRWCDDSGRPDEHVSQWIARVTSAIVPVASDQLGDLSGAIRLSLEIGALRGLKKRILVMGIADSSTELRFALRNQGVTVAPEILADLDSQVGCWLAKL